MRKVNTLFKQLDFDQGRLNNKRQTIFKTRPIQLYKVNKVDKWQKELEDIKYYIEKEIKRIAKSKRDKREKKFNLLKRMILNLTTLQKQII